MEQKQQTINSQTEGDEAEKTIRDIFEGKIGGDRSREVVGHFIPTGDLDTEEGPGSSGGTGT
jgi:hypothetical protein